MSRSTISMASKLRVIRTTSSSTGPKISTTVMRTQAIRTRTSPAPFLGSRIRGQPVSILVRCGKACVVQRATRVWFSDEEVPARLHVISPIFESLDSLRRRRRILPAFRPVLTYQRASLVISLSERQPDSFSSAIAHRAPSFTEEAYRDRGRCNGRMSGTMQVREIH